MENEINASIKDPVVPILIVDDNQQYASILRRILENGFGYKNITCVESTDAAYETILSEPTKFKLLFVDYRFPSGSTGGQLLEKLAHEALLSKKVAFLITSEPSTENVAQAKRAGALGVLAKPFDREQLRKQLEIAERAMFAEQNEYF